MHGLKGQSSFEFLSVVSIALLILVPGTYLFVNYTQGTTEQVTANQLNLVGRSIISRAEEMYVIGRNSFVTNEYSIPGTLIEGGISEGQELFFEYSSKVGISYVVFFPVGFNISHSPTEICTDTCIIDFDPGSVNRIKITSQGDFVSIEKVE